MRKFQEPKIDRLDCKFCGGAFAAILFFLSVTGYGQQQQTQTIPPIQFLNSQYVQGVSPGYTPTAGGGLTLNLASGTAYCFSAVVSYIGGTLTMSPSATNYVYLDSTANCAPAVNTTGFNPGTIPIAAVSTGTSVISSIMDDRTWFTTGLLSTTGSVGIGLVNPSEKLEVQNGNVRTDNGYFYSLGVLMPQMLLNGPGSYFGDIQNDQGNTWSLGYTATSNPVLGTPVLSWNASNRVGIGNVTTPAQTLDVNGSGRFALNTLTFSPAPTFDASRGNTQKITLTSNVTGSTLSNASAGEFLYFLICQDATGGRAFTWPSNVKGGISVGPTAGKCTAQAFVFDGTNAYALTPGVTNQ